MLLALFLACSGDIGIRTVEQKPQDTATVVDTYISEPSGEPASEPTSEPTSEPSNELYGTVGLINYDLEQVACPACMGVSQEITISFEAKFHDRIEETHPTWVPEVGNCTTNVNPITINVPPKDIGQSLFVQGNPNSFTAYNNGTGVYNGYITESQYDRDTLLNISAPDGSAFQFFSIHGYDNLEPWEMRYVDPSYAFAAVVSKMGTNFQWAPFGSSDKFNITIATYSPDGAQLLGVISCTSPDSGNMYFDGSYFQSYPTWSLTAIHMTRFSQQRVPYPALGGYVDVQLEWSVVGTGHIE